MELLTFILTPVLSTLFVFFCVFYFHTRNGNYWLKRRIRFIRRSEIATLWERLTLPQNEYDRLIYKKFKDLKIPFGGIEEMGRKILFVTDLNLIKHILVKDFDTFPNRGAFDAQQKLKYFKDMLVIKDDKGWKDLRSTLSPTFSTSKIRRVFDIFEGSGDQLVSFIKKDLNFNKSGEMELKEGFARYTFDVIASAAFGLESEVFQNKKSIWGSMGRRFMKDLNSPFGLMFIILFPKLASFFNVPLVNDKIASYFVGIVKQAINHRRTTGEKRRDFLQILIDAQKELENVEDKENTERGAFSDDVIAAQCLMFFLGGFDTPHSILMFTCYELAMNQKIQTRLHSEINNTLRESGGRMSYELINTLDYLDQVISESLRMYTSGIRSQRKCSRDYKIPESDTIIPKGTIVAIPVWALHRDEDFYPNPDIFDPDRFCSQNKANRLQYTYLPFGVGPRHCIGMRFALMEVKVVIAKLVMEFEFHSCPKTPIPVILKKTASMKPADGLILKLSQRN